MKKVRENLGERGIEDGNEKEWQRDCRRAVEEKKT